MNGVVRLRMPRTAGLDGLHGESLSDWKVRPAQERLMHNRQDHPLVLQQVASGNSAGRACFSNGLKDLEACATLASPLESGSDIAGIRVCFSNGLKA